jgi:hypothetical protein
MPVCNATTTRGVQCKNKATFGTKCKQHKDARHFSQIDLDKINSEYIQNQLHGLGKINKITNLEEAHDVVNSNILPRVIHIIMHSPSTLVRDVAITTLINLSAVEGDYGSRSILHAENNICEYFADILIGDSPQIIEGVCWCLSHIAVSCDDTCTIMEENKIHIHAAQILTNQFNSSKVRKSAAFLLSNLGKKINMEESHSVLEIVSQMPPRLQTDPIVLPDLVSAISSLYKTAHTLHTSFIGLLLECLQSKYYSIFIPTLKLFGDIVAGNQKSFIERLIASGLTSILHTILLNNPKIIQDILWIFSNLAVEPCGGISMIEEPGLLLDLNRLMLSHNDAIWTISNLATCGEPRIVDALLTSGSLHILGSLIHNAKDITICVILEGCDVCIEKCGSRAIIILEKYRNVILALQTSNNVLVSNLAKHILDKFANPATEILNEIRLEEPQLLVNSSPIVTSPIVTSTAVTTSIARYDHDKSRGLPVGSVDVNDLLFTSADVAYLIHNGYRFLTDGRLCRA